MLRNHRFFLLIILIFFHFLSTAQLGIYQDCYNNIELRESILKEVMNSQAFKKVIHAARVNNQNVIIYDYQTAIFGSDREFDFEKVNFEIHFWEPKDSTVLDANILFEIVNVTWLSEHIFIKAEFLNYEFQFLFKVKKCLPTLIDESWSIY